MTEQYFKDNSFSSYFMNTFNFVSILLSVVGSQSFMSVDAKK